METTDPIRPVVQLVMQGPVTAFADIRPERIKFFGKVGELLQREIRIRPYDQYPFKVLGASSHGNGNIHVALSKTPTSEDKDYVVTVTNLQTVKTRYADTVILKTDSAIRPELKISVYGAISDMSASSPPFAHDP